VRCLVWLCSLEDLPPSCIVLHAFTLLLLALHALALLAFTLFSLAFPTFPLQAFALLALTRLFFEIPRGTSRGCRLPPTGLSPT